MDSPTDPTAAYYKTKRNLLLFVGCLLLAIFAGFKIVNGEQKIAVLPFQLERPELLATILFVAVLFNVFQFSLQWAAQRAEVQANRFHRIDFISTTTTTISGLAILCYLGSLVSNYIDISYNNALSVLSVFVSVISVIFAFLTSRFLEGTATRVGRWIKGKARSKDEKIARILKSDDEWILLFNPQNKRMKQISFNSDGTVGIGKNDNESSWRVRDGLLEIMNSKGEVFSRFSYDETSNTFNHTNDDDTLSIRSQIIFSNKDGAIPPIERAQSSKDA